MRTFEKGKVDQKSLNFFNVGNFEQRAVPLNTDTCSYIDDMVRRNAVIKLAMTNLINDAMNVKPEFYWGSSKVDITPEMEEEMNEIIIPCCIDNIMHILCYGVGVVAMVQEKTPFSTKKIVRFPRGKGIIYTYYDTKTHAQSFFYCKAGMEGGIKPHPDPHVTVLSGFGSDPSVKGDINSVLASLIDEDTFSQIMEKNYLSATERMSAPILLTETPLNKPGESEAEEIRFGIYGEKRAIEAGKEEKYRRTVEEMGASKITMEKFNRYNKAGLKALLDGASDTMTQNVTGAFESANTYDMRPLPPGHKAHNPPSSQVPPEFLKLKEMSQEMCAAAFGMALSQLKGLESHTTIGAKNMTENYNKKLHFVRTLAGKLMTHFYRMMHADGDADFVLENVKKMKRSDPVKLEDLESIVQGNMINIYLPATLNDTLDNMIVKYSLGAVDKDELNSYCRISAGLKPYQEGKGGVPEWPEMMKALAFKMYTGNTISGTPLGFGMDIMVRTKTNGEREGERRDPSRKEKDKKKREGREEEEEEGDKKDEQKKDKKKKKTEN